MRIQLVLGLIKFFVFISALSLHGCAGFNIHSLTAAFAVLHFKVGAPDLRSYRIIRPSPTLLQNDPTLHNAVWHPNKPLAPSIPSFKQPAKKTIHGSELSPSVSFNKHHHRWHKFGKFGHAPEPSHHLPPTPHSQQGHLISPTHSSFPSSKNWRLPAPAPSPIIPSSKSKIPIPPPIISPLSSSVKNKKTTPPPPQFLVLPAPPPNQDCISVTCTEPLTYTAPGSPCGCVWPIQIRLRLSVALYTFFPLVSELAKEIAGSVSLNRIQVRIMGANAANHQLEKTIILINLVPLKEKFDAATAFAVYQQFWKRSVFINPSLFGDYEVVYVRYPGLPPSPPSGFSSSATINDLPFPGNNNDGRTIKPLGIDVPRRRKDGIGERMIAVIVLSSIIAFAVCMGVFWLLFSRCRVWLHQPDHTSNVLVSPHGKPSGAAGSLKLGSWTSSASMSFGSSLLAYTGNANIFSVSDLERATDYFDASRILGEGGFGLVYSGILDDDRKVAVKVLKRDDHHGTREFLAEVEMLSRLHHRNLVKLIGICTEDHCRCLVYELVPNGSVESHLHGVDKETAPLDWCARMKIALGAARGLAYLHEDSSPRVIHRDFKSSNILLEHDFTPKVSDFGLARAALDEGNKHISTHVMGTFGYLAPEYAMTGHLLVKSDVYSYGVVLLELLTGRKPVDFSHPPGQENLVAWALPLLATKEGLEAIIDPTLKSDTLFDSMAKVSAIASMCVQPEVSHRPFMGEVVQALKLLCNEFDETREHISRSCSQKDFSIERDGKHSRASCELVEASKTDYPMPGYDSVFQSKMGLSASDLSSVSAGFEGPEFGSFRKKYNSSPLKMGKKRHFWQRLRELSSGSMSDQHGFSMTFWPGSR